MMEELRVIKPLLATDIADNMNMDVVDGIDQIESEIAYLHDIRRRNLNSALRGVETRWEEVCLGISNNLSDCVNRVCDRMSQQFDRTKCELLTRLSRVEDSNLEIFPIIRYPTQPTPAPGSDFGPPGATIPDISLQPIPQPGIVYPIPGPPSSELPPIRQPAPIRQEPPKDIGIPPVLNCPPPVINVPPCPPADRPNVVVNVPQQPTPIVNVFVGTKDGQIIYLPNPTPQPVSDIGSPIVTLPGTENGSEPTTPPPETTEQEPSPETETPPQICPEPAPICTKENEVEYVLSDCGELALDAYWRNFGLPEQLLLTGETKFDFLRRLDSLTREKRITTIEEV